MCVVHVRGVWCVCVYMCDYNVLHGAGKVVTTMYFMGQGRW